MKGKTNNPNGRPKGSPNKSSSEMRAKITALIENNWDGIQFDIEMLEPKDRLNLLEKLIAYTLPKLQSVQVENNQDVDIERITVFKIPDNGRSLDYKAMSSDELRAILASNEQRIEEGRGRAKVER